MSHNWNCRAEEEAEERRYLERRQQDEYLEQQYRDYLEQQQTYDDLEYYDLIESIYIAEEEGAKAYL